MRFLNKQPLQRQIVAATAVLLLFLIGGIVWSANLTVKERQEEVRDETATTAVIASAYVNQYLDSLDSLSAALVRNPVVKLGGVLKRMNPLRQNNSAEHKDDKKN